MSSPILKRVEALEGRGTGGAHPMLVIVSFIAPREGRPDAVGIDADPPHFPMPLDRLPEESWDAFKTRLAGMLSHLPGGSVVLAFASRATVCPKQNVSLKKTVPHSDNATNAIYARSTSLENYSFAVDYQSQNVTQQISAGVDPVAL